MKRFTLLSIGLLLMTTGCDVLNSYITDAQDKARRDLDGDGVLNIDDCDPRNNQITYLLLYPDLDGDGFGAGTPVKRCALSEGFSESNVDCDDTNKAIHPNATEICDHIDNNCDNIIDTDAEKQPTWYEDADQDKTGNPNSTKVQCDKPAFHISTSGDCDDTNPDVHPGAKEICNLIDDDCNGIIDTDSDKQLTWYRDNDGDGHGWKKDFQFNCNKPDGYVLDDNSDCNDDNPDISPSADEICNGSDDDCDEEIDENAVDAPTWYADKDQDLFGDINNATENCAKSTGQVADFTDCDDTNKLANPGAVEICNTIDDNCNDIIDLDAVGQTPFYADVDEDGYGKAEISIEACVKPSGWSTNNLDCNDADPDIHPNAEEVCNGIDDNCDGVIDTDAENRKTFFLDADEDGFGDLNETIKSCSIQPGYASVDSDCNDQNPNVFPNAKEVCNGIDDDCNGIIDTDAKDEEKTLWFKDTDGDGFGTNKISVYACTQPEEFSKFSTDCNDLAILIHPGAIEECNSIDDNCDGITDLDAIGQNTYYADADNDGYGWADITLDNCVKPTGWSTNKLDCNDKDADIRPNATELCNSIDDNCDGVIDLDAEDRKTYFSDNDSDGYGNIASSQKACSPPKKTVTDNTDCNDENGLVHPGAKEICNLIDDNCNDIIDTDAKNEDKLTLYKDTDSDGFGDPKKVIYSCELSFEVSTLSTDCNDINPNIHPDAEEICNGLDDNCNGIIDLDVPEPPIWFEDLDNDGYGDPAYTKAQCTKPNGFSANATDCDPGNKNIHPNAQEVCNGIDDDCDGETDELFSTTWWLDEDNDGFGRSDVTKVSCAKPNGYADKPGDCDDSKPLINPNGTEICDNGIDENCNDVIDDAIGATQWFIDIDGDGFGNVLSSKHACKQPPLYVAVSTDCNDFNPSINPDAPEDCKDGIDNNCNDVIDTDAVDTVWYADTDKDGYGTPDKTLTDCAAPHGFVGNSLDCHDENVDINPGVSEICNNGFDDNCDGSPNQCAYKGGYTTSVSTTQIIGSSNMLETSSASWIGDVNGDGFSDLAIGILQDDTKGENAGAVFVFLGPISSNQVNLTEPSFILYGRNAGDQTGSSVSSAGDFNQDGLSDFAVGARYASPNESNSGIIFLVLGSHSPTTTFIDEVSVMWSGENQGDNVGTVIVPAYDFNQDGFDDIAVGVPKHSANGSTSGAVYLICGSKNPTNNSLTNACAKWVGEAGGNQLGQSLSGAQDVNGDGISDLVVAARHVPNSNSLAGGIYLLTGSISPTSGIVFPMAVKWTGEFNDDQSGVGISSGDVNSDGLSDLLIGAPNHDAGGDNAGAVYIVYGSAILSGGSLGLADAKLIGESAGDQVGTSLSANAQMNQDTFADLLIGSPNHDAGGDNAGAVYLVYGSAALSGGSLGLADAKLIGNTANGRFGRSILTGTDTNSDNLEDFLIQGNSYFLFMGLNF